ncbi:hypothetical protein [Methanosphaerula palustris]|uniref:hypothetical protein n=1 Tax=Methanosphaerula palustris TaxID=475088 RepID=UPI0003220158|nr:hypothetical protein [Methanosphaerula palustris]
MEETLEKGESYHEWTDVVSFPGMISTMDAQSRILEVGAAIGIINIFIAAGERSLR